MSTGPEPATYRVTFQEAQTFAWATEMDVTSQRLTELLADADEGRVLNLTVTQDPE
jgi:hypothetical protein